MAWTCPECRRQFGAVGRRHDCRPGLTLEQYFATARPETEPIFGRIHDRLRTLEGDLIIDPLHKMIRIKNGPTIAVVESKTKWVVVGFSLRRRLVSPRLSRKVVDYQGGFYHVVNLTSPDQVDDELLDWLTEAFHRDQPTTDPGSMAGDGMVPDDVDDEFG